MTNAVARIPCQRCAKQYPCNVCISHDTAVHGGCNTCSQMGWLYRTGTSWTCCLCKYTQTLDKVQAQPQVRRINRHRPDSTIGGIAPRKEQKNEQE